MVPDIKIDIKFPPQLMATLSDRMQRKVPGMMRRIANDAKSFWKSEAGRRLKSSRKEYVEAIHLELPTGGTEFSLMLSGSFVAFAVETGTPGFDMKPGFLAKAKPINHLKKRYPRAMASNFAPKSITQYRIIPLNVNRYINMTKPTVFRTVHDQSPATSWMHPGFKGVKLADAVLREIQNTIIPKHIDKLFEDY